MGEAAKIDLEEFRGNFEAIGRQDWDAAQTLQHPDMVWHDAPEIPDAGVHVGGEAIRRYWKEELFEAWERWHLEVREVIPSGDRILATIGLVGKARHTGIELQIEVFQVYTFKDGLAIEQRAFLDREQAFEAAGISASS